MEEVSPIYIFWLRNMCKAAALEALHLLELQTCQMSCGLCRIHAFCSRTSAKILP